MVYEMATGRKAFEGKSQASLIHAIMGADPPAIASLQRMSPPRLDEIVRTCLAKDPDDRWQSAGDLGRQLKIIQGGSQPSVAVSAVAVPQRASWRQGIPLAVATLIVGGTIIGVAVWSAMRPGPAPPRPATRFAIAPPSSYQLGLSGLALSPDGRNLVYPAIRDGIFQLYRREMDQLGAVPIRGTEGALFPFLSPDGESVGFFADGALKKMSLAGGPAVTLCDAPGFRLGASWGPDDTIVFASSGAPGLMKVSAAGGVAEPVTTVDADQGEAGYRWLDVLPDGKAVLFTVWSTGLDDARIAVRSMETGEQRVLADGTNPRYAPTGHIIFARDGSLWAVPFDVDALEVTGPITPVLEGVQTNEGGLALFALAGDGSLAYVPGLAGATLEGTLVWVSRDGREVEPIADEPLEFPRYLRLSPAGRRLALTIGPSNEGDLWVYDLEGRPPTPLTFEGDNLYPVWMPDGTRVAFQSTRAGAENLFSMPADGSTLDPEPLLTSPNEQWPTSWSPDGRELIFTELRPETGTDILALPIEGEPRVVVGTEYNEFDAVLSPDGRWLAYVSNVTGGLEVWVLPYPGSGAPIRISPNGGVEPVWARDGRELFYVEVEGIVDGKMMAVAVETEPEFRFQPPEELFEGFVTYPNASRIYDVAPDGRFAMIYPAAAATTGTDAPREVIFVHNWFEELQRLVRTDR